MTNKAFTLWELVVVVLIVTIILVVVVTNGMNSINRAKYQATVREMDSIATAAIQFYNSSNDSTAVVNPQPLAWPSADASNLGSPFLPRAVNLNPFGTSGYTIAGANNMVTVSTTIPKGIPADPGEGSFISVSPVAQGQLISLSKNISNEFTGRLAYELKYVNKQ
ncbi:MAG: prepilin-type N-terminal cleavage/methylation domain-containing protein [Candidatus Omnitrophica bacterium]|nr:prepilin-type N-terminal cleavage/methylation domain-containing protein [Candidatus Omnitrophota bacterium]